MLKYIAAASVGTVFLFGAIAAADAAAPKRCKAGKTWSKSKGACVAARIQKKQSTAMCMRYNFEGGLGSVPCAD